MLPTRNGEPPVVHMENITKRFGTIVALDGVTFTVERQEVHALLGDNGAGKSTLIKVLTGVYQPTSGEIYFEGRKVHIRSPREARDMGIETVYQDLALIDLMSITRNFFLGRELVRHFGPLHWLDMATMHAETRRVLTDIGITVRSPDERVGKLSGGERQSIAIGRAMYFGAKLLILDEPTSALSVAETRRVLEHILEVKEKGLSVIFITHNVYHVYEVADTYTILRHGKKVGTYRKGELSVNDIADLITGVRER
ncbi:MAG: sugar ABC transporter ATP-binding protein [Chloroflexi bacterium]|nr:sugar ABC transporter ATP-binding protein [Chloroflexota bacterium]